MSQVAVWRKPFFGEVNGRKEAGNWLDLPGFASVSAELAGPASGTGHRRGRQMRGDPVSGGQIHENSAFLGNGSV